MTRLFGSYAPASGLAITPSRPAPSKRVNQSAAIADPSSRASGESAASRRARSRLELGASLRERRAAEIAIALAEKVPEDDGRGELPGQHLHARRRRVQPELQRLEVEPVARVAMTISPSSTHRVGSAAFSGSSRSGK